jgi:hypothetical protein
MIPHVAPPEVTRTRRCVVASEDDRYAGPDGLEVAHGIDEPCAVPFDDLERERLGHILGGPARVAEVAEVPDCGASAALEARDVALTRGLQDEQGRRRTEGGHHGRDELERASNLIGSVRKECTCSTRSSNTDGGGQSQTPLRK